MKNVTFQTDKFPAISYSIYGTGNPIVLLHGFPFDRSLWSDVVDDLSKNHQVIVPDLPGCGESSFIGEDLTVEDMAEFVCEILTHEKIERAVIAGHSMGGYAAVAFAELYPENLAGIAFVHSFATGDDDEKKILRRKSIELFKKGGGQLFVKQMIPTLFSKSSLTAKNNAINELTNRAILTDRNSLVAFYNAMINRADRTAILYNSEVPVMWIYGEDDQIACYKKIIQQSSLSNVNFVYMYNSCGHMSMIEMPDKLADHLYTFANYCYTAEK